MDIYIYHDDRSDGAGCKYIKGCLGVKLKNICPPITHYGWLIEMPRNLLSGVDDDESTHAFISTPPLRRYPSPEDTKVTGDGGGYMIANNGRVFFLPGRPFETREFGLRAACGRCARCKTRSAKSAINGNTLNSFCDPTWR